MIKSWLIACGLVALALPASGVLAQGTEGRISGTVTAAEGGAPIAAAHVVVVGTRRGATTDDKGHYSLTLAPGTYHLRVARIGFGPMQMDSVPVTAGQTTTADFQLKHQAVELSQMVVVGYGTQQRRDVTGAVASVSSQEVKQTPTTDPMQAIKGRVAGVDIVSTGYKPGDGVQVRIRGQRSIKASNDPLYVLDGIPMAGGIGDLSPQDIQSIEILKDASATAIYGSRGANGVVLITTRHGQAGTTRVTFDSYAGAENALNHVPMMNGQQFADYKREAYRASGDYFKYCPDGNPCAAGDKATFYPQELAALQSGVSTDWQNQILRQGAQLSNQIGVSGGNARTQYAVSGNMLRDDGIVLGQNFNRKSMRVNIETQANSRLRFGGSALVLNSIQNLGEGDGLYSGALSDVPLASPTDSTGALVFKPTPDPLRDNPVFDVQNWIDQRQRTRTFGTLFGEAKLTDGLTYRVNFGPDLTFYRRGVFQGAFTVANQGAGANGSYENQKTFDYTLDNILTYNRAFGASHRIDATLLYSIEKEDYEQSYESASGLPYESQLFYNLGSGATITGINSTISQWALQSYMARLNYAFRDRYLLTLTTRIDGSSRLAAGRKYAIFPSVALGWRAVDRQAFGNTFGPFDNVKFRASYGRTGNTSVNPYQTEGSLTRSIYSFSDNGAFGYAPGVLPNPNLRWETTGQYDVGVDFGLLDNRLTGTVDAYMSKTTDLLMDRKLPPSTGYLQVTQNVGSTQNKGLELTLSDLTLDGWHGIRWSNDVNFSMDRNAILSLTYGNVSDPGNRWFIGQPINGGGNSVWYDYRMLGIWQTADSAQAKVYGEKPGMIRLQDVNGDGIINTADLQILGNTYPKWTGGFNSRVDWKLFDAEVQVITRQGLLLHNTFLTGNSTLAGRYNNLMVNYWTPTNPSNTEPRPNKNQEHPVYGDERGYQDGSFTRVRNITLGVTVPERYTQRIGANSLRIYGTAENPLLFTRFTGLDPEGRASAGTPSYKMFLLGASLGF